MMRAVTRKLNVIESDNISFCPNNLGGTRIKEVGLFHNFEKATTLIDGDFKFFRKKN